MSYVLVWFEPYFHKPPSSKLLDLKEALMVRPTVYLLLDIEGTTLARSDLAFAGGYQSASEEIG